MAHQISPFSSGPRNEISVDMILSLMQDPNKDEIRHNVEVLIYLMTHLDVKIVQSGDMNKLLDKTYCFTP